MIRTRTFPEGPAMSAGGGRGAERREMVAGGASWISNALDIIDIPLR